MKKWMATALAIGAIVVGDGGVILYTTYLAPKIHDVTVYVAAHNMPPNYVITPDDISTKLIPREAVEDGVITDVNSIVGKMAAEPLATNQQITNLTVEDNPLVPTKGLNIVPINSTWISAVPDSLRRGDLVNIYIYNGNNRNPGVNTAPTIKALAEQSQPILRNVPVEFVHNGSNQEVIDVSPQQGQSGQSSGSDQSSGGVLGQRQNGSADPSKLELLLSDDDYKKILTYVQQGNTLIFEYTVNH